MNTKLIEAARLRELLDYNQETGIFTWKVRRAAVKAGAQANSKNQKGYIGICVDKKHYKAHRVAWLFVYGSWPDGEIDHINGVKDDNRISNLRAVPKSLNQQNQRQARSDSSSGLLGVSWYSAGNKWKADIRVDGKKKHLGYFHCKDTAHQAYLSAKRQMHEGNTL